MKVIESNNDKIVLRGYGQDAMGASFADYGLTINLKMNSFTIAYCICTTVELILYIYLDKRERTNR
jgi:hypothetical protein